MSAIDDTIACIGQLDAAAMVAARERQGTLIAWIHTTLGAVAVIPFNPKRTKNLSRLAPTWTADALGKRSAIERFFGRLFRVFPLQRPPWPGWTAVTRAVALTFTATLIVALAAHHAGRPDLIRSPHRVLAHLWEGIL